MKLKTRQLTLTAIMTAFVFVATFIPKIPIPLGYVHLGNAAIFLAVMFGGRRVGILSGVIGSALADFLSGFPIWIVPTIFIKAAEAEIFWRLRGKSFLLGLIAAGLVMAAGYTLAGAFLFDSLSAGLASTPGLLMEAAINLFVTIILSAAIKSRGVVHEKD